MNVLFVASEVTPIAKVGGLGDVIGALPKALANLGVDVRIISGYYGTHDEAAYPTKVVGQLKVIWAGQPALITLRQTRLPGADVPVYLLEEPRVISDGSIYESRTALAHNQHEVRRFLLLSQAAVQVPHVLKWLPDIWHLHDWHAACVAAFLPEPHVPTLLTIHNLANQGWATPESVGLSGLPVKIGTEHLNLFRLGLERATWLSTVSPTYALEIQSQLAGEGLEAVLSSRRGALTGITNGIDVEAFNPQTDKFLAERYSESNLVQGKRVNRELLGHKLGLESADLPLFGIVSRLTDQKGIELIPQALEPYLKRRELQLAFLGVGQPTLEGVLRDLVAKHPGWVGGAIEFNEPLARLIYAGSDFFLMPSRFEPCGLGQLIAMRYGTVPVVRATGGLRDTVVDVSESAGTGLVFAEYTARAFGQAVERALRLYQDHAKLQAVRQRALERDSSWPSAAAHYLELYQRLCQAV